MNTRLNKYKYPGAKRLMLEAQELKDTTEDYCAQPIDDNLFEWHFTVRGPPDTAFDGGYYHGRLSFPTEYPMKPPSIILLTPNGRFETNKKICLSISGYHPETWQPSWSVRTALVALIAFMPTKANRAIGSLDYSDAERRQLAAKSRTWSCETCGLIKDLLAHPNLSTSQINNECVAGTSQVCNKDNINNNESIKFESQENDSDEVSDKQQNTRCNSTVTSPDSTSDQNSDAEASTNGGSSQNEGSNQVSSSETTSAATNIARSSSESLNISLENHNERRRLYSTFVLKSIFILLSILILRRVVMVIQS